VSAAVLVAMKWVRSDKKFENQSPAECKSRLHNMQLFVYPLINKIQVFLHLKLFHMSQWCHKDIVVSTQCWANFKWKDTCFLSESDYNSACYDLFTNSLAQGFPTFLLPCTPSAFRQMSMYPFRILTDKYVPLQHFDRCTCTPKISCDNTFYHDYS